MEVVWTSAEPVATRLDQGTEAFLSTWSAEGYPAQPSLEETEALSPRTPMIAREMLMAYLTERRHLLESSTLLSSEQPFAVPIPDLEDVWYVGRMDKVVRIDGQVVIIEHKTTTEFKQPGTFRTSFVESWASDSQLKGYQYAAALSYKSMPQVWVDAALVHKKIHNVFKLIPIYHSLYLLKEWLQDTRDWIKRILSDTERGYFPKNEESCTGRYGPCPFLDICRSVSDPSTLPDPPDGYIKEKWEPFTLLKLERILR